MRKHENLKVKNKVYAQMGTLFLYQGMIPEALEMFMTAVDQAIAFRLDEEGAEASAATSVEFGDLISPGNPEGEITTPFHVDRPFLFVLAEKSTGSILFMGKVTER